jgi:hypothetical protein
VFGLEEALASAGEGVPVAGPRHRELDELGDPTGAKFPQVDSPSNNDSVSFETDIKPLFRERDRQSMEKAFDLWSYDDVRTHSSKILERVKNGSMPCDGAWPPERVQVLQRWVDGGTPP